jgi:diguanylate cyclase (GGDEF)-like protein
VTVVTASRAAARTMRRRLVASIFLAGLLPFVAAYWIASSYVSGQEHRALETRLAFSLRSAGAEYADVLAATRTQAHELAARRDIVLAMSRGDVKMLRRLLNTREAVVLASGTRVGWKPRHVPVSRVQVSSRSKILGTILVAAPKPQRLLPTIRSRTGAPSDILAVLQSGRLLAGPAGLRAALAGGGRVHLNHRSYIVGSVALPGYSPPVRVIALADETASRTSLARLRRRLGLAGLAALVSIVLYSVALSRPLGRWFDQIAEVARQADLDPLTEISNRRGFELALETELVRSTRYGRPCSLVLTDLDDFKGVNDEHGHDVGDAVLVSFSRTLREHLRTSDVAARIGGEEFALVLPELDLDGAVAVAQRIQESLAANTMLTRQGREVHITASFGVAEAAGLRDPAELTRIADEALYNAKRNGKNRVIAARRADRTKKERPSSTVV